ncbi:type II secretion system protein [Deinococcus sedimenti]|uniref:Prepilin-type N-terminal cleavage/methylation domain-containing protein n=1 Tax=Deinococcus sedimenti TaxID=1867090 RepID=A0ABQ2S2J1_9DEIO|nr:type II secretion system protein [Deinococcus sedimenti]GGR91821.1 hypothetical protein GCM10008960_18440 [Deinococcus sedimenti]
MTRHQGFTIIELLVGMAILAILTAAVFSFQQSTTVFAASQNGLAQRLQTVNDISGYLGDRLRAASRIVPDGTSLPDGTAANTLKSCDLGGTSPCIALVLPVVEDSRGAQACGTTPATEPGRIVGWTLNIYRYVPRADLDVSLKTSTLTSLDGAAQALVEIQMENPSRPVVAAGSCGTLQPLPDATSAYTSVLGRNVITDLAVVGSNPGFEYDAVKKYVTMRLRTVESVNGKLVYTPSADFYTLRVNSRNVD